MREERRQRERGVAFSWCWHALHSAFVDRTYPSYRTLSLLSLRIRINATRDDLIVSNHASTHFSNAWPHCICHRVYNIISERSIVTLIVTSCKIPDDTPKCITANSNAVNIFLYTNGAILEFLMNFDWFREKYRSREWTIADIQKSNF